MLTIFLSYLLLYKYLILFLVVLLASIIIPLPATALLIAAGAFSIQGYFNIYNVLIFGFLASVLGDCFGYLISFRYGKKLLEEIGLKKFLQNPKFISLEKEFIAHSSPSIFLSRFLFTHLGTSVNILSGMTKISSKKFFFYDASGEAVYVLLYCGTGYFFGSRWEYISNILGYAAAVMLLIALVFLFFVITKRAKSSSK